MSSWLLISLQNQASWPVTVVILHRFDNPLLRLENVADGFRLAVAELQHHSPPRFQEFASLRSEPAEENQPVRPAIQRAARIEIAHLGLEQFYFRSRNVRRIADDEVELKFLRQWAEAVAMKKLDSFRDVAARRVLFCQAKRLRRNVAGPDLRGLALDRQRDGEAAAARAEVQGG